MEAIHAEGYMVEADFDGQVLRARGTNKMGRVALAGQDHANGDVVLPRESIAQVSLKDANRLTNGNLVVRTTDGRTYQLHFRRKSAAEFKALHAALTS